MKLRWLMALVALVFITLGAGIQDYLADMKTTMKDVENCVEENIANGSYYYPPACALIAPAKRPAIVRAAGEFARSFVSTAAFKSWYEELRESRRPEAPKLMGSMSDMRSEQVTAMRNQIAETEKARAAAPADQQKLYNDVLAALKSSLKEIQAGDASQDAVMNAGIEQQNAEATAEYKQKLAAFEKEYPKGDPRPMIRRRLQTFLQQTEGVDFGAKLQRKGKQMVFVNSAYENMDSTWKRAFRAGKEATDAARAFAREWLNSL
jgi:hypothetical protein